jgi:predicted DNA-binding transcriptional regulator AlpA
MTTAHPADLRTHHVNDDLLSLSEVAGLIRVPVATLRYWRHLGTGPHSFKVGRSVRYWRTDVLRWLEERSTDAHATR